MWYIVNRFSYFADELLYISLRGALVILFMLLFRTVVRSLQGRTCCILWVVAAASFLVPAQGLIQPEISYESMKRVEEFAEAAGWKDESEEGSILLGYEVEYHGLKTQQDTGGIFGQKAGSRITALFAAGLFLGVWLSGMAVLAGSQLIRYIRWKQRLSTAVRLYENVYSSDQIQAPLLFGVIHPRIILPVGLDPETAGYAVCHEQMHQERCDSVLKMAFFGLCTVYWWNPMVWIMYVCFGTDTERACDEMVLLKKENSSVEYAQALLNAEKMRSGICFAQTFSSGSIKVRVKHILSPAAEKKKLRMISLFFGVLLLCMFAVRPRAEAHAMSRIWKELAAEYPEFPATGTQENRNGRGDSQEGALRVYLIGGMEGDGDQNFHDLAFEMAEQYLLRYEEADELYIYWRHRPYQADGSFVASCLAFSRDRFFRLEK